MPVAGADAKEALAHALAGALSRWAGRPVTVAGLRRLTGGTSHDSWAFDADDGAHPMPFILRRDFSSTCLDLPLDAEYALLTALHAAGYAVPRPCLMGAAGDGLGGAYMICERLADGDVRKRMARGRDEARDLGERLVALQADLHRLDWRALTRALPPLSQAQSASAMARRWADDALALGAGTDPLLAAAFDVLVAEAPETVPHCLVHGDFKANNLVSDGAARFAVIDWELAHIGDPLEDVAWTMLWTTPDDIVGGMLSPQDYLALYARASGNPVDPVRLAYWRLFVCAKLAVVFLKSARLHAGRAHSAPTHVMLLRAMPWIGRQVAARLIDWQDKR